jgi:hypothetical protein
MNMLSLPFFAELETSRRVLLAGAGGGYDVFCALPLYFALRDAGKEVFLATRRTEGSRLWINPLMALCWTFRLEAVARRILYLDAVKQTEDYGDLCAGIELFRARITHRPWQDIPV